jgi:hypothetical protein
MEKTIKIFKSFEEQEKHEIEYWQNIPGNKKLEILEVIRANYWAMKNESPQRLQRVYRIIKRSSS